MTICAIEGCENQAGLPGSARGWCHSHYRRWRRYGDPLGARQRITSCIIDGCGKPPKGRGWCAAHYSRWQRHGDPLARLAGEVVDGCRICPTCDRDLPLEKYREPIDRAAKKPNMMCASVDHIVPISKGGAHSRANVQAAHLRCNVRKGDRIESGVAS